MKSRGRRTQERAAARREVKLERKREQSKFRPMVVPEHIKALGAVVRGR